jgi:FAD/FMN-containing dehydrogenase/Fe-S oxidoreductase
MGDKSSTGFSVSKVELPVVAAGERDVAGLQAALREAVSGEVYFDRLSRALYSTDASVYQIVPLGVVSPRNEADVAAVVRICSRFSVPITARGGGTSQAGQAIGAGLVLDFSKHLNRILEINAGERWARVQPGCVLDDLNRELKPLGLQFAPDISTSNRATVGGMLANNSSGAHSVIHGKTIDHVLGMRVMLADGGIIEAAPLSDSDVQRKCTQEDLEGACYRQVTRLARVHADEIDRRYPKILRRVGGYNLDRFVVASAGGIPFNLTGLFVGSEGTLGITLEAKLRLIELPKAKALLVIHFTELLDALAATPGILEHAPAAVEVIDRYVLDSTRLNPEAARLRDFLEGDPGGILIVEFYGDRLEDLPARLDVLEQDLRRRGWGYHYHRATDDAAQGRIWKLRKAALGLSMAEKGDAKAISFVEDAAVAPKHLRDYIAEVLALVKAHGTSAGVYAHASVGCLHVRPVIDLKTEDGVQRFESIANAVSDLVLKYGGALSGEHGDGLVRSPFQEKMFGPALYGAFRELKRTFDPQGLFNPGKIVDSPPLRANLRYGPSYVTPDVPTLFDFSADGGIVRAAELCAGVGECRKKREGTMCPSFQATGEEQHSTRGRANALRLALTRQLGFTGLTDPVLAEALDLCLECKACKSECPTNVDMARLKAEFLHQYYERAGLPWRNWLFGNVSKLSRRGLKHPRLFNRVMRSRPARWLNEMLFGIDRRRMPPALASGQARARFHELCGGSQQSGTPVLLFVDTFADCFEPAVGSAALNVLRLAGCEPVCGLPEAGELVCCGRPMISNGMLVQAQRNAQVNVEHLYPWAASGKPIVACEPSCILTIKDDYPALLKGDARCQAEVVAAQCRTFEDFLDECLATKQLAAVARFPAGPKRILLQGHCHQRALVGMGPTMRLLRRIPGAEVIDLDAGCCGMAGSFGYEKEHYEVSRLVGEQRLFPAVRQTAAETVIVAPGFSCRLQIHHFTGRTALHPASLLWSLLDSQGPSAPARKT